MAWRGRAGSWALRVLIAAGTTAAHAHRAPGRLGGAHLHSRVARLRAPARVHMAGSRATVTKEVIVPVPAHHLYDMLANYSRYKEIWPGEYQAVQVLHQGKKGGRKEATTVEFIHKPVRAERARARAAAAVTTSPSARRLARRAIGWQPSSARPRAHARVRAHARLMHDSCTTAVRAPLRGERR